MSDSTHGGAEAASAIETPTPAGDDRGSGAAAAAATSSSPAAGATAGDGAAAGSPSATGWGKDGSANDYSRFENLDDPEKEGPLAESLRAKDRGNAAFKAGKFEEAITHYTEGIADLPPKRDDKKNTETRDLRVTLYCNRAACHLKMDALDKCVTDTTSAVGSDAKATKALFRRAQAYEKLGKNEDACRDLYALVRQDPGSKPARKAYARVKKQVHSRSLQAIVDAYNAAEAKAEKDAREKAEKKAREAAKKKKAAAAPAATAAAKPARRKPDALSEVDKLDAHEDEAATLSEVKKKGYCYFNTKMDAATQALYKNTAPQRISSGGAGGSAGAGGGPVPLASQPKPLGHKEARGSTGSGSGSFSEWNKAGTTWEEKDVSTRVNTELPEFLNGTGDPAAACITSVPACSGTASVACVRARLRFFFELAVDAKFSATLADGAVVTGTLKYPSLTALDMDDPDELFEVTVKYDGAATPAQRAEAKAGPVASLLAAVERRVKEFASDFLATF